jgi:ABC-2 type transport system ATP-binding protein
VLELQGLSRRYGDVVALDDLSFTVGEGQMFGFVGPNGAGKTTAMRIVLGVLEPDRGEVRWRGRPVDAAVRRRFGYMPEDHGQTFSKIVRRRPSRRSPARSSVASGGSGHGGLPC